MQRLKIISIVLLLFCSIVLAVLWLRFLLSFEFGVWLVALVDLSRQVLVATSKRAQRISEQWVKLFTNILTPPVDREELKNGS